MTQLSTNVISANTVGLVATTNQKNKVADSASFEQVMLQANFKADSKSLASQLLDSLIRTGKDKARASQAANDNAFPFSSAFESAFGTSGPLIDFINLTTTRLNLSAEQNQALQNIAINNKDITNTPANVAKISAELKQAGIG